MPGVGYCSRGPPCTAKVAVFGYKNTKPVLTSECYTKKLNDGLHPNIGDRAVLLLRTGKFKQNQINITNVYIKREDYSR